MPPKNSKHYNSNQQPFGNDANFANHPGAADMKIQPKSPKLLLDMRYFRNFLLVSLGINPCSRRCVERTRQGEGRWSRPSKPAFERSYLTENSSSANRILRPRRKKLLTESLKQRMNLYIYICMFEMSLLRFNALVVSSFSGKLHVCVSTSISWSTLFGER